MSDVRATDIAARAGAIATPIGLAAYAVARPDDVLLGGVCWLGVLVAVMAGLGHLVERAVHLRVDLGLRMAWGAAGYLVVAGALLAAGVLAQPALVALVIVGLAGYAWRQLTETPAPIAVARALAGSRQRPYATALYALIAALAAVNVIAAVAEIQGNVYDDDVIYTPMVRRLLDVGDL